MGPHDEDFVENELLLGLLPEIHLFDGDLLFRRDVLAHIDHAGGAKIDNRGIRYEGGLSTV